MIQYFLIVLTLIIAIAFWVYRDAEARGKEGVYWLIVILLTGMLGLIVWFIVRPEKIRKKRYEEQ